MTTWFEAVASLRSAREPGVLVTVTDVRGHAPREAGAKMVVSAAQTWASIGGGNLEEEAVRRARALLSSPGGPESFTASLSDKAPFQHGVQCCGGEVTVLLDPLPVVPSAAVFGVGHVGLELARILARHDLELHLVDSRPLPDLAPLADAVAAVHAHEVPVIPELVLAELPRGTHVLVLTHDHAEDLAIVDAALRCDHLGPVGLIGSSAKWARFRRTLLESHAPDVVDRVQTPIGLPGVTTSKEPAAIAVAVAAGLLAAFEREGARA
ncbi:xanthine dehydrogenase accessory protein XdhC [Nocardioides anomalus]|uniref:Xanthine dehydrogenase accessory protein XdhC n=1 Tax=Nocardioides anomalus TaxID=2712223 RepID=A0A6G6WEB7_9ACTN|nr:xanthine dehydrogenase accessory protein XdhC [Nocardioides anomalus]QIG43574.1 xanthine dehydrogenase accessory protein XdhC [Nocardioides anomalus]